MPPTKMLTRNEVAEKLNISIRTLDRYIRRGFFEIQRSDRNVWISEPSFEDYYEKNYHENSAKNEQNEEISEAETIPVTITTKQRPEPIELNPHEHGYSLAPAQIYQSLYEELKEKYDGQVKRLEGAHYRVGQLEAQIKSMVPMIEFKKERKRLLLMDQKYKEDLRGAQIELKKTNRLFETERLNKNVYITLVYALLGLQPVLWLLMR